MEETQTQEGVVLEGEDRAVAQSTHLLEKALDRSGVGEEKPERAVETAQEPRSPETPAQAPDFPQIPEGAARRRWERQQQRRAEMEAAAERRALLKIQEELGLLKEAVAPPPPDAPALPDFDADPEKWYEAKLKAELEEQRKGLLTELEPLINLAKQQGETAQQHQERVARERQAAARDEEYRSLVEEDEATYIPDPVQRQAYNARVNWFEESMTYELLAGGAEPDLAQHIARENMRALVNHAASRGQNTAAVIDAMAQARIRTSVVALQQAGAQIIWPGQGGAPAQRQTAANPDIAAAKAAAESAASGGATGSVASTAGRVARPVDLASRAPNMSVDELKKEVAKRGKDARQAINQLLQAGNAARQARR